jgi:DNA mismatch endonuclease (patch repair protein)
VFVSARVIVFVDSDFWHGRLLLERGEEALAAQFRPAIRSRWMTKVRGNAERDRRLTDRLRHDGWKVIRVWESDIHRDPRRVADAVTRELRQQRAAESLHNGRSGRGGFR